MQVSKEGRARLVKLMMRRNTSVLSAMNDREIQQIAQKSTILQVSHKSHSCLLFDLFFRHKTFVCFEGRGISAERRAPCRQVPSEGHVAAF